MAHKALVVAVSLIMAGSPVSAAQPDTGPLEADKGSPPTIAAPPGTPDTKYCMSVEITGNVADPVMCWTRDEWADQGVDVDREWAKDGVRTVG